MKTRGHGADAIYEDEFASINEDEDFTNEDYPPDDPWDEDPAFDCSGFFDRDGRFFCMAAGSEDCDWECPFSRDIGMTARQIQRRDDRELAEAIEREKERKKGT